MTRRYSSEKLSRFSHHFFSGKAKRKFLAMKQKIERNLVFFEIVPGTFKEFLSLQKEKIFFKEILC